MAGEFLLMVSKYIHYMKFTDGKNHYEAKIENDDDAETWGNCVKRCKEKYFAPAGITITEFRTEVRDEKN